MFQRGSRTRIGGVVAGVALLITAAQAAGHSDRIQQSKEQAVRAALKATASPEAASAVLAAAAHADALLDIRMEPLQEGAAVALHATGQPECHVFAAPKSNRVFIDLKNTVNLRAGAAVSFDGTPLIRKIRSNLLILDQRPRARVVLDLSAPATFSIAQDQGSITVTLKPEASNAPAAEPVAATPDAEALPAEMDRKIEEISSAIEAVRQDQDVDAVVALLNHRPEIQLAETPPPDAPIQLARFEDALVLESEDAGSKDVQDRVARLTQELDSVTPAPASEPLVTAAAEEKSAEEPAPAEKSDQTPAEKEPPPPPEKRTAAPEKAAPSGPAAVTRMKQVLTGLAGQGEHPADEAVKSAPLQPIAAVDRKAKGPSARTETVAPAGNPMDQVVNIDFREMDLANVVALLAQKGQINVIAGSDLTGSVTASLKGVTLRRAIDTVLRMNGLGIIEEEGIYRIVPYEEAQAAKRKTAMVKLENAKASELKKTLDDVMKGSPEDTLMSISANESTNVLIIAGPDLRVAELQKLAKQLDVAKPVTPTVTEAIKINNADPKELETLVKGMLSKEVGKVAIDDRSRHVVVTDEPVVLEQVRELLKKVDMPVKQVSIDSMIVDAVLTDDAETGVDWITKSLRSVNKRNKLVGSLRGPTMSVDATGEIVNRGLISDMVQFGTGYLTMGVLTNGLDIKTAIAAQVTDSNAKLLANPVVVTVENKKATINISEEIPYQESKQSLTGPPMVSTAFKEIGIILEVTPRVTHDDHVIAQIMAKESRQQGTFNDIPVEAKRTTDTTLRMKNGQTIFIGGLRRFDNLKQATKVPILGDIPIMNIMFRNNIVNKQNTELLVFLTCNVLPDEIEDLKLSPELQTAHDSLDSIPKQPNAEKALGHMTWKPNEVEDNEWKWRRSK